MPFGAIYAALFFAGTALLVMLRAPDLPWFVRVPLAVTALALAFGLLTRRSSSRWAGAAAAALLGVAAWPLFGGDAGLLSPVVSLAAVATSLLLVLPATGDFRRHADDGRAAPRRGYGPELVAALSAAVAAAGFLVSGPVAQTPPAAAVGDRGASPASTAASAAPADRVRWTDYGRGLERARRDGMPMLVAFVTDWCGYCKRMDRTTWNDPEVVSRVGGLVTVRVDAEETRDRSGYRGAELAGRYGIRGFPTLVLLDASGRELDRVSGYLEPRRLLGWIERTTGPSTPPVAADSLNVSRR